MSEWQDISTAPKDGTRILIARAGDSVGGDEVEITEWYVIKNFRFEPLPSSGDKSDDELYRKVYGKLSEGWNGNGHRATHWMPLPEPPEI